MEKLLLKFILAGSIEVAKVRIEYATNEQFFKILKRLIIFHKKNSTLMKESDLLIILKNELNNTEYRKTEAYIQAAKDFPTDLKPEDVLHEAKVAYLLRSAESTIAEVADAGLAKDKDLMLVKSKELYEIVQASKEKPSVTLGTDVDEDLFFLDSFSPSLNELANGLAGLTIVGAASGGAKSMLAINEVCHQWHQGNSSLFFSLEMPVALVEIRMISCLSGIGLTDLLKSKLPKERRVPLNKEDAALEAEWRERLKTSEHKIYIIDNIFDMDEITSNIVAYKNTHDISLVVIDYLNLASSRGSGENWMQLSRWIKELNQVAVEHKLVILSPTQIMVETNPDGSLQIKTRGSTELLNSASLAILLYRDEETKAANLIALHITKVRTGIKGVIALENQLSMARLKDVGILEQETY
jgi:replicative DNA helicase